MNDEQEKRLNDKLDKFFDECRASFAQITKDGNHGYKLFEDIYRATNKSTTEAQLLGSKVEEAKNEVKDNTKEVQKSITEGVEEMKENLEGKKTIVIKERGSWWKW
mgnify:CR=1 FL=1